mmetsp:Transcript_2821/g.3747  ORF Transcript_2821/g.3747 Transcript_2821/m.3747 type:complete len:179 (+) Transcript_2821:42-578(+)
MSILTQISCFSVPPPLEILLHIIGYLKPFEILVLYQLNWTWNRTITKCPQINLYWWKLCMEDWYEDSEENKPKTCSAKDKKREWKNVYMRLGKKEDWLKPSRDLKTKKNRDQSKRLEKQSIVPLNEKGALEEDESQFSEPGYYKKQMRVFYKSVRSKPKGKVGKGGSAVTEWEILNSY